MKNQIITLTPEAARLIPYSQLAVTNINLEAFTTEIERLNAIAAHIPGIKATEEMQEHPAVLHYFAGGTDIYICEFDGIDEMFGFTILNGDLECSEFGYTSLEEIKRIAWFNLDYHFESQSIEFARYKKYPAYFKKPVSAA
ncbi:hypothetical protein AGMMS49940_24440 [Spirochaetia bacterium]|nr:hypothetical protein AGMMS49940_24440 [Spirochaetia bacterium]